MNAPETAITGSDPIAEAMQKVLDAQRQDYLKEGHVSAETRIDRINRGIASIAKYQDQLVDALSDAI